MQQMIFIAELIACTTCFGHHYANHQELESIIQQPANRTHNPQLHTIPTNLKTKAPNTTGSDHPYKTLEFLMMGIMVPETCWASNKICNKNHLLHVVGILFPHITSPKRSNSIGGSRKRDLQSRAGKLQLFGPSRVEGWRRRINWSRCPLVSA